MDSSNFSKADTQVMVANMYYKEGLSQDEIASRLFVSRPTVSRLLKSCLADGVVTIRIKDISSQRTALAKQIRARYGLKQVIVVQSDENLEVCKDRVGAAAAEYLKSELKNGDLVGISWGTTVNRLLYHLGSVEMLNTDVIQILGDSQTNRDSNATQMTLSMANLLGGTGYVLQAPLIVRTKLLRDLLLEEPHMQELYEMFTRINVIVMGFGGISAPNHPYLSYGDEVRELYERVRNEGATCDLCGAFLDANGLRVASPLDDRTFAMPIELIRKVPTVIGMGAGVKKRRELLSVLRGGYFNVVVIDENLAAAIL